MSKKYKERAYTATKERYGDKTKYQNLGREPEDISKDAQLIIDRNMMFVQIKQVLGMGLFIEWSKETGLITDEFYAKIKPAAKHNERYNISKDILDITTDEA
tara:strand:- start:508 stop:813 length:306 start_codon:yes stop_codon:yes gene_type:complete